MALSCLGMLYGIGASPIGWHPRTEGFQCNLVRCSELTSVTKNNHKQSSGGYAKMHAHKLHMLFTV